MLEAGASSPSRFMGSNWHAQRQQVSRVKGRGLRTPKNPSFSSRKSTSHSVHWEAVSDDAHDDKEHSDTHDLLEVLRAEDGVVELDGLLDVGHVQLTMRGGRLKRRE